MAAAANPRTWRLTVPAPDTMYSANTAPHWSKTAAAKRAWRNAVALHARKARLPKRLARVRIDIELRFTTRQRRDSANYHAYVGKPCVDGLGPARRVKTKNGIRVEPGHGLLPDDTPEYLDGPHLTIGEPVARAPYGPAGEVVITITDLTGDPDA